MNTHRPGEVMDSLRRVGYIFDEKRPADSVRLTHDQAIIFLNRITKLHYWKNPSDPLRTSLNQLLFEASHEPYDSAEMYLKSYPFDSLQISWDKFYIWEPLRFKIPVISPPEPHFYSKSPDISDSSRVQLLNDTISVKNLPASGLSELSRPKTILRDTTILVVIDTLDAVSSKNIDFPFSHFEYPYQSDSLKAAVNVLTNYLSERDSSIILFTGRRNENTPVWLNSKTGMMHRFWLKSDLNDSVTVWIGSQNKNTIGLYLENGISFLRPSKQLFSPSAKVDIQEIDRSKLLEAKKITVKKQFWKYRTESMVSFNQAYIENWVKGGESSISTALDVTGFADYDNKAIKITSKNYARLKYGLIWTDKNGIRKNLDLFETNSKLNHKAFGKFDFSAILLFKTQVAKGFTYPTDTTKVLVSKFMNPSILTLGIGLDYKPNKFTSINISPFSYKGTFITDTAGIKGVSAIDQTKYGIAADRKSKNEPGASFVFTNEFRPFKKISVTNRLQLFTNYINNPQNIDVDWEMIFVANINWFTEARINTHLIFDDDTKSPLFDKNDKPVLNPVDGKQKKTARVQFKELLGFSFVFKF